MFRKSYILGAGFVETALKYEHFFNFQSLDSLEERFSGPEV